MKHNDWTRRPTPIEGVPIMAEGDEVQSSAVLAPSTTVSMSVRTFISLIAAMVVVVFGVGTTYFALASTDKDLANRHGALQEQIKEAATKQDLRALRLDMREDLLNSAWSCDRGSGGSMKCRITLPRQVAADTKTFDPELP